MDYDGSVKIATELDIKPVEKGLKEAEKQVKETADSMAKAVETYAKKNEKALSESIRAIEAEAKAKGETVSAQAKYNAYLKSYIDLLAKSNGVIKEGHPLAQKRLEQLKKARQEMEQASGKGKGLNTVLNEAGVSAQGFASKIGSAAQAGGPYVAAAVAAIAATTALADSMRECTEYYKVQQKAETALATAAKNNPYIDGQAVAALKEFASELQGASDIGDEVSIKLMTPLVASGRTKEQIKQIMQAAADISASGAMSMDSAVKNLSKTYGGLSGELGETIPEIKNLTEEQLKNGEAVKIVQEQYKGMAKNLADARTQAESAKGDFKEMVGSLTAPAVEKWDIFWKGFWENATKATEWIKNNIDSNSPKNIKFLEVMVEKATGEKKPEKPKKGRGVWNAGKTEEKRSKYGRGLTEFTVKPVAEPEKPPHQSQLHTASTQDLELTIELLKIKGKLSKAEQETERQALQLLEKRRAEEKALAEQKAKELEAEASRKAADDYAQKSNEKVREQIRLLELEAKAKGESVKAQDVYNVYINSYLDLLTKTDGKIKESYPIVQKRISQIHEAKKAVEEQTAAEKKLKEAIEATNEIIKSIKDIEHSAASSNLLQKSIEQYQKIKAEIEKMSDEQVKTAQKGNENVYSKQELLENLKKGELSLEEKKLKELTSFHTSYFDTYRKQQEDLLALKKSIDESEVLSEQAKADAKKLIDEEYAQNKAALAYKVLSQITEYTQQAVQVAKDAGNLMLEYTRNEKELEMAQINERYEKGEISEKEYEEKRLAIKKKAARKEYQIRMFQWTASLLAAAANIAEGVSKAIAQGGIAGLVTGTLVGLAGGVQIAAITASKPIPPSFATGGIVGGSSYYGDHVPAFVNSGEMIANFPQQRRLWAMLNGQEQYKPSFPVTVNNTQANRVNAEVREQNGSLFVDILDKHINKGLVDGSYDSGFAGMNAQQKGIDIL